MSTATQWRLEELVRLSQRLVDMLPEGGDSKRVRWHPNERLVRYYTTLGLLARPAAMKGRTAYYDVRHLLQVLAIKTLQARGQSLQDVQLELGGLTEKQLEDVIGLPPAWREQLELTTPLSAPEPPAPPARFWERAPADLPVTPAPRAREEFSLLGLELMPGVQLTIDSRLFPPLDPGRLRRAAAALCDLLEQAQQTMEDSP